MLQYKTDTLVRMPHGSKVAHLSYGGMSDGIFRDVKFSPQFIYFYNLKQNSALFNGCAYLPFQIFREDQPGNFYTTVLDSTVSIFRGQKAEP